MRLHVVGLPHTRTSKEFNHCPHTQNILNFCRMMMSFGHQVIHYGNEGSEVPCEHVDIFTRDAYERFFGTPDKNKYLPVVYDLAKPYWQMLNHRAQKAIRDRQQPRDFVCLISGSCNKPIADKLAKTDAAVVEYAIGSYDCFARYKVFSSYSLQSLMYGRTMKSPEGNLFDAVIPHYVDPNDFPNPDTLSRDRGRSSRGEYLLMVGRIFANKGVQIAVETAKRIGAKLILAGQGIASETSEDYVTQDGILLPKSVVEYVGHVTIPQRNELMQGALAVMAPTRYVEPFGMTAVEAQMCGTPVISTDFGGFVETVVHGQTGYRCRTLSQFVQAANSIGKLHSPWSIREAAERRFSLDVVRFMYQEYFDMVQTMWGDGWYTESTREQLHWLPRAV